MAIAIFSGGRGNVSQTLTYRCGVPGCEAEEYVEQLVFTGEPLPDPWDERPDGWRLLHGLWVCPGHFIVVEGKEGGWQAMTMEEGTDHWEREGHE